MGPYTIRFSSSFKRAARRFFRKHPDLRPRFEQLLVDLSFDPRQPSLQLHQLIGELDGLCAVRLTYSYRVTLTLEIHEEEIALIGIGEHDEVYRA